MNKPIKKQSVKKRDKSPQKGVYHFNLVVETFQSRERARIDVLAAFAKRNPDGCKFFLEPMPGSLVNLGKSRGIFTAINQVESVLGALRSEAIRAQSE